MTAPRRFLISRRRLSSAKLLLGRPDEAVDVDDRVRRSLLVGGLAWAGLLCAPGMAAATESSNRELERLLEGLRKSSGMAARFVEEKHIALLKAPLRSAGALYFSSPETLARHVEKPKRSVLLLSGTKLRMADDEGSRTVDLAKSPALAALVQSFVQVLRGDRAALDKHYRVELGRPAAEKEEGSKKAWQLRLTPLSEPLDRMVRLIEVTGTELAISRLVVEEASGDRTITQFSDVQVNRRFTDDERKRWFSLPGER